MSILDTIAAPATPRMMSALSVVRMSGSQSLDILQKMVKRDISSVDSGFSFVANIYLDAAMDSDPIDSGVVTVHRAPRSYTGENLVEFSVHGNPLIVDQLMDALVQNGARWAKPGEFTMKAAVNGKMSLVQAEAVDSLIRADSPAAKSLASSALKGRESRSISDLRDTLLECVADAEYALEADTSVESDEESIERLLSSTMPRVSGCLDSVSSTIDKGERGRRVADGVKAVICGDPNTGKSSLLNAMLGEDKAIVTSIPGTTRDIVEGTAIIGGVTFHLLDTAGIRDTDDPVEKIGVDRAISALEDADIVLLVSDSGDFSLSDRERDAIGSKPLIKVGSKSDISGPIEGADVSTSSLNSDVAALEGRMLEAAGIDLNRESYLLSERDLSYMREVKESLGSGIEALRDRHLVDVFSDSLRRCVELLDELLGNSRGQSGEDIYQTIFSRFCLGK